MNTPPSNPDSGVLNSVNINSRVTLPKNMAISALSELMCIDESEVLINFPGLSMPLMDDAIMFDRRFVFPDVKRDTLIVRNNQYYGRNRFIYYIDLGQNPPELYEKLEKNSGSRPLYICSKKG